MAITIKSAREIELMTEAGRILEIVHEEMKKALHPGMSTKDIDRIGEEVIRSYGCIPSFLNYHGYPASICVSVNDEVVHGIPSRERILQEGDIVSLDAGLIYKGYHSDAARTYGVGEISKEAKNLIDVTRESFYEAIKAIENTPNPIIMDIGKAVSAHAEANGFSVVRKYVGHGVGASLHEFPNVPNYPAIGDPSSRIKIIPGMTLAIEPMINQGTRVVKEMPDGWTVVTGDGKLSAHYEHSIAVTDNGIIILTKVD